MRSILTVTVLAASVVVGLTQADLMAQGTAPPAVFDKADVDAGGIEFEELDEAEIRKRGLRAEAISDKAFALGFKGEIAIDVGSMITNVSVSPDLEREGFHPVRGEPALWPFASVTKQLLAARLVDELDSYEVSLDTKVSEFVPGISRGKNPVPTLRQLLQHRSGLRNPDDTPMGENGWPAFYNEPEKYGLEWCLKGRSAPPKTGWSYNNCDYIVLGAAFEELSFENWERMLVSKEAAVNEDARVALARFIITPENANRFYAMKEPESQTIPAYGASAAIGGTLQGLIISNGFSMARYDKALKQGGANAAFWTGDPKLGYMALGHWVFDVEHPSCDAPIKVSQRKGEIGQYRLENIMLPELRRSMVFATTEPSFEFGEIWAKQGFLYDAVGALACGDKS